MPGYNGDATVLLSMLVSSRPAFWFVFHFLLSLLSLLYMPNYLATTFLVWYRVLCAWMGVGRGGGVIVFVCEFMLVIISLCY